MNETNRTSIDRYATGAEKLRQSVAGLTTAQFDAFPIPGTWSIRQIVVHLLHAEVFMTARVLQIAAEDVPLVMNWDEHAFIDRLHYEAVTPESAIDTIAGLRATTTATLRALDDADFARVGIHSKVGKMTVADFVKRTSDHLEHHLTFVVKKRSMV